MKKQDSPKIKTTDPFGNKFIEKHEAIGMLIFSKELVRESLKRSRDKHTTTVHAKLP